MPPGIPVAVCKLFETWALYVIGKGKTRHSADAILHKIRWEEDVEQGNRAFKCNDHWTAPLARWFMACHPKHQGFFETRERVDDGYREDAA